MQWFRRIVGLRPADIPVLDLLLGVGLAAIAVVSTALEQDVAHPWSEIIGGVTAGSLALRTRAPLAMALAAAAGMTLLAFLPGASTPMWAFVAVLLIAFSTGAHLAGSKLVLGVGALLISCFLIQFTTDPNLGERLFTPPVLIGGPALAGWLLHRSRAQALALRRLAAELAAEKELHAAAVAVAERTRIARELHDVVAHSVSVMVVQAGAAEQLMSAGDAALPHVRAVRSAGREALSELRRSLGVLRSDGGSPDAPQPTLADLPALASAAGARLTTDGPVPDDTSPGLHLAAYRIVQEALTNARRHAPGAAVHVRAEYRPDAVVLTVDDEGGPPIRTGDGAGHGLRGMAERAGLYGGTASAGPRPDGGGWRVTAELPLRPASAETRALAR